MESFISISDWHFKKKKRVEVVVALCNKEKIK